MQMYDSLSNFYTSIEKYFKQEENKGYKTKTAKLRIIATWPFNNALCITSSSKK